MDSTLEAEIDRLSRPPGNSKASEQALPQPGGASSTTILQPQNGRLAEGSGEVPDAPPQQRLSRNSSAGSSSGGKLRSPRGPGLAAAVLAGNSVSPLMPVPGPAEAGGAGATAAATSAGGSRPRLPANGEKMAGPSLSRPALNGEKMAGPSRPAVLLNGEKVAGFGGAATATATGGKVGGSKEEEVWKKSEEALKKKEQSVRNALKAKQRTLQQESLLLATVDRELAQLALDHQTEVNDLRKTLEVVDRELAFLDRDAQKKLEAFEKARLLLAAKVNEKTGITSRLTELIMASEKKRDAKLNEIMKKMSVDGGAGGAGAGGGAKGPPR